MTKHPIESLNEATRDMSLPVMLALLASLRQRMTNDHSLQDAADYLDQAIAAVRAAKNVVHH